MAGKPRAECRIVPEEVWVRARAEYQSGMTAAAVAGRHGMTVAALRGRVSREGWTRAAHAEANATSPVHVDVDAAPILPDDIARAALARASAALTAGRPAEAQAIVDALDGVLALAEALPQAVTFETFVERSRSACRDISAYAENLAERMLGDGEVREHHARRAFAWRAEHLAPEAAAGDRAYAERMGWAGWLYDAEGRLTSEEEEGAPT